MPRGTEITDKPGFSYFLSTPCDAWDPLEYYEEWYESKELFNKAKIALAITRQLKWFENEGTEKEKKEDEKMLKHYKVYVFLGFWARLMLSLLQDIWRLCQESRGIRFARVWNTFLPYLNWDLSYPLEYVSSGDGIRFR